MKYQPIVDIYKVPQSLLKHLQRGQWVTAGGGDAKGVWCGQKPNGLQVVCWHKGGHSFVSRRKTLMGWKS